MDREASADARSFIMSLRGAFPGVLIVVAVETAPPGWGYAAMAVCRDMRGVFFVGRNKGANDGIGVPMAPATKLLMAQLFNSHVCRGLTLSPRAVLYTNLTDLRLKGGIVCRLVGTLLQTRHCISV